MKIALADDDPDFLLLLTAIIRAEPSFELVGTASDAEEAVSMVGKYRPDVVLLDVSMPRGGGVYAASAIRRASPRTSILALSGSSEKDAVVRMLRAGAMGYLIKGATPAEIVGAITDAAKETPTLPREAARQLLGTLQRQYALEERSERERIEHRAQIEDYLAGNGVEVAVQPVFDLRDNTIVGYEALARLASPWNVPPDVWFARAEAVGLRVELELALLGKAIDLLPALPSDVFLAINLSPDVVTSKEAMIATAGAYAPRVVLEITEHAAVADYSMLTTALTDLRSEGIRIAVDDAGAGFASLHHILQLAPEFIKLDTSLTRHIDHDSPRRALAASLIAFSSQINSAIVAEGIETDRELAALRYLGVQYGQGYYLARPGRLGGWAASSEDSKRLIDTMSSIATRVQQSRSPADIVTYVAQALLRDFPITRVSIRRIVEAGDSLEVVAVWSNTKTNIRVGTTMSSVATALPEVIRTDGPVSSEDCRRLPNFVERLVAEEGIRSWISIPIHDLGGNVVALLSLSSTQADFLSEMAVGFLTQLGRAIESPIAALLAPVAPYAPAQ